MERSTRHHVCHEFATPHAPPAAHFTGTNVSTDSMVIYSTADLIRRAEEDIAAGKHLLALGLLAEAARREPTNPYIGVLVVKADKGVEGMCALPVDSGSVSERRAQLATLAMRNEFGDGIGLLSQEFSDPAGDGRVKLLTMVATNLYERGALDEAVQSLMKAHMLDPENPHVERCERLLQPALETMRKRQLAPLPVRKPMPQEVDTGRGDLSAYLQKRALPVSRPLVPTAAGSSPQHTVGDSRRLEALRARQDLERRKREIMQWRQASGPPGQNNGKRSQEPGKHVYDVGRRAQEAGKRIVQPQPQNTPQLSAFFSKLKQGKLFG